ncbi:hypothetical protein RUM43_010831 [Polyplax serrata]|uniref:Uncharacterized protein n=1 Tax=Polyplax serrata TaxID=468196 RepID=A0AAN8S3C9_POLSC
MKGWFDAFRNDGGPTLYSYSNRTPVTGDVSIIAIIIVFSTLLAAFLFIFPGIRKEVSIYAIMPNYIDAQVVWLLSKNKQIFVLLVILTSLKFPKN